MTSGAAEFKHPGDALCMHGPEIRNVDVQEEQPPIAPAAVLCLAAVVIATLGLNFWKEAPGSSLSPTAPSSTLLEKTATAFHNDWRVPMRLHSSRLPAKSNAHDNIAKFSAGLLAGTRGSDTSSLAGSGPDYQVVPSRPPTSFKVAAMSNLVFDQVQSDQWSVPTATFPQMMAQGMHNTYSAHWKPMVSWRESTGGDTLLPVARVRCGGLSPQAVARRADKFDVLIGQFARKYEVDESLVKAIITRESCFDQSAVSHVGAIGLMQLMPDTAQWLKVKNPAKAEANLAGGVRYFASLHKEFGSLELALAAYNAGPGNVRRYGGIPPFRETQSYVKTVLGFYRRYLAAEFLVSS